MVSAHGLFLSSFFVSRAVELSAEIASFSAYFWILTPLKGFLCALI
jgi:hypothetical protein